MQLTGHLTRRAGGVSDAVRGLAGSLHAGGIDVHVVGLADPDSAFERDEWAVPVHTATVRGPHAYGYAPALISVLRSLDPEVIHVHGVWMYPSVAASKWRQRSGRPLVLAPHGMLDGWALENAGLKKRLARSLHEGEYVEKADVIHALTDAEAVDARQFGAMGHLAVVPNGVTQPLASSGSPPWAGRIGTDARVLLFLGRLHPKKGLDALVDGFARAIRDASGAPWHLAVVGWDDGGHSAALRERVMAAGLDGRVHLLGPHFGPDKEAAFAHADAFVLPSFSEGLPMAVLEAWAHRLPVVMTDACNLPEGFAEGAAVRVSPDAASVADGLRHLFALAPADRRAMGERGRHLVETRFTWPRVAEALSDVYRWALGQGPIPPCVSLHE